MQILRDHNELEEIKYINFLPFGTIKVSLNRLYNYIIFNLPFTMQIHIIFFLLFGLILPETTHSSQRYIRLDDRINRNSKGMVMERRNKWNASIYVSKSMKRKYVWFVPKCRVFLKQYCLLNWNCFDFVRSNQFHFQLKIPATFMNDHCFYAQFHVNFPWNGINTSNELYRLLLVYIRRKKFSSFETHLNKICMIENWINVQAMRGKESGIKLLLQAKDKTKYNDSRKCKRCGNHCNAPYTHTYASWHIYKSDDKFSSSHQPASQQKCEIGSFYVQFIQSPTMCTQQARITSLFPIPSRSIVCECICFLPLKSIIPWNQTKLRHFLWLTLPFLSIWLLHFRFDRKSNL